MILRSFSALAAITLANTAIAAPALPEHMKCIVSGHAGCAEDGICVGAGTKDPAIHLNLNTLTRDVDINNIKGKIEGSTPIVASGQYRINWRWRLIGMNRMRLNEANGRLYITLSDGGSELEFKCP